MTLHHLHGRLWPIVCPPSDAFLNSQNSIIPEQYVVYCQPQPIISGTHSYQWYTCYMEVPKGLPYTCHRSRGINLVAI